MPWKPSPPKNNKNNKKTTRLNFLIFFILCFVKQSLGAQAPNPQDYNGGNGSADAVIASAGVFLAGFTFVVICTWAWWRRQYRKLCPVEPPPDIPVAAFVDAERRHPDSYGTMRSLDASTLESDITIEPLPSLHRLTNIVQRYNVTETGDARLSFESIESGNDFNSATLHAIVSHEDQDPHTNDANTKDWFDDQQLSFPRENINYIQELGSGWFGKVIESEATDILPFPRKARVVVQKLKDEASEREETRLLQHSKVYRDSNHKNIVKLLGHCLDSRPFLLILEHYPKGDLKAFLHNIAKEPLVLNQQAAKQRNKMALDIANGLKWMHDNGLTHPDLATRNCLVGQEGQVVVGDYGLARVNYREDYYWGSGEGAQVGIPLRWMAPESLEVTSTTIHTRKTTREANIWSFGVVVWELCELAKFPYSELSDEQVMSRVIQDKNYTLKHPSITTLPFVTLRDKMVQVLTQSCHGVPNKRPNVDQLVQVLETPL